MLEIKFKQLLKIYNLKPTKLRTPPKYATLRFAWEAHYFLINTYQVKNLFKNKTILTKKQIFHLNLP